MFFKESEKRSNIATINQGFVQVAVHDRNQLLRLLLHAKRTHDFPCLTEHAEELLLVLCKFFNVFLEVWVVDDKLVLRQRIVFTLRAKQQVLEVVVVNCLENRPALVTQWLLNSRECLNRRKSNRLLYAESLV